jgi:hypothetical protein
MTNALRRHFEDTDTMPTDEDIWSWVDLARDRLSGAADKRAKPRRAFASPPGMQHSCRWQTPCTNGWAEKTAGSARSPSNARNWHLI